MKEKVPNYADFSDGQLHQAVERKEKKKRSINLKETWKQMSGFVSKNPIIFNNKNSTTKEPK